MSHTDEKMLRTNKNQAIEDDLCVHIFSVSAGMVGICLTVIGLVKIVIAVRQIDTLVDSLLAVDALLFLISCLLAYWALRTRNMRNMRRVERMADIIFIIALLLMVVICGTIAYAVL
jgi:hypothetical protein